MVGRVGVEPTSPVFQTGAVTTLATAPSNLERETGFEPAASSLARRRSTTELFSRLLRYYIKYLVHFFLTWCAEQDSNLHGFYPTTTSTLRVYQIPPPARVALLYQFSHFILCKITLTISESAKYVRTI